MIYHNVSHRKLVELQTLVDQGQVAKEDAREIVIYINRFYSTSVTVVSLYFENGISELGLVGLSPGSVLWLPGPGMVRPTTVHGTRIFNL